MTSIGFPAMRYPLPVSSNVWGLSSTYYVRTGRWTLDYDVLRELHDLGHEVGYHYEVLSRCNGDRQAALALFARELAELRSVVPIHTAAMHGSPLSAWNNLDLWQGIEPAAYELAGEPYLSIDYSHVAYYTDTGRTWADGRTNFRDRVGGDNGTFPTVKTTDELTDLVAGETCESICIQTHPERWNPIGLRWLRSVILDLAANNAKAVIAFARSR